MERKAILNASYLDILFDNRNKQYGGYELRKHYNERVRNALLMVLGVCVTFSVVSNIHKKAHAAHIVEYKGDIHFTQPPPPPIQPMEIPKPVAPPIATIKPTLTIPKIVSNETVIEKPAPDVTTTSTNISLPTGNSNTTSLDPTGDIISSNSTSATKTVVQDKPMEWVEQMPVFNGSIDDYITTHLRYPQMAVENNIQGQVIIRFVVNEDGSVSDAQILRGIGAGCDEEAARIVKSMPNWKPGKQNGRAVKVYFTLPIKFTIR
jgi:protein TonB